MTAIRPQNRARSRGHATQQFRASWAQAVLSVPLRGVSLAPLQSLLRPQPGLAAFAPPSLPPPSGAVLADRQSSDPSNVRAMLQLLIFQYCGAISRVASTRGCTELISTGYAALLTRYTALVGHATRCDDSRVNFIREALTSMLDDGYSQDPQYDVLSAAGRVSSCQDGTRAVHAGPPGQLRWAQGVSWPPGYAAGSNVAHGFIKSVCAARHEDR